MSILNVTSVKANMISTMKKSNTKSRSLSRRKDCSFNLELNKFTTQHSYYFVSNTTIALIQRHITKNNRQTNTDIKTKEKRQQIKTKQYNKEANP